MTDPIPDQPPEARAGPRRGKAKARTGSLEEAGSSTLRQDAATPEPDTHRAERGESQAKEKKKPRKLERRSVVLEEPVATLDTRVDRLERHFQALSSRVDAVEVRQVRRPTAATYRRSSSTSTRATSAPRVRRRTAAPQPTTNALGPRPSLADQLRESQRLRRTAQRRKSHDSVEEIPDSAVTATSSQSRQVALTGQYNIPLPSHLTAEDIVNLRSGLTAAGSIARSLAGALTSSREDGSGTSTPRGGPPPAATTGPAPAAAGPSNPKKNARGSSTPGPAHGRDDGSREKVPTDGDAAEGSATSTPGNRQPEEKDVVGAEHASQSWRSFIASAVTDLVTSAARDAAVEIQSTHQATEFAGTAGTGRRARRREGSWVGGDGAEAANMPGSRRSSTARPKPKASRTSSRASSFRV